MHSQAFEADRQTDDVSLAVGAKSRGNRVDNGVKQAIHDRTSHAVASKRGTNEKMKEPRPFWPTWRSPLRRRFGVLYSSFAEIRGDVK
jgi:hypothetical protein